MRQTAPDVWIALVTLLAESGRKTEAKTELDRSQRVLPEVVRPMVMARCQEALGNAEGAEGVYLELLKTRPNDSSAKRTVAAFYLRIGQVAKAEPYLKTLAGGDNADSNWARRTLALSLAVSGDYQKTRQALQLLDKNLNSMFSTPEDQRARAMVLALRPGDRRASIKALEDSFARVKPTPPEEFLLAQLYEADRNWTKANERLVLLVTSPHGKTPEIMAYFIRALLRHNQTSDARALLVQLEKVEPDSARTNELKARILKEDNKADEAGRLLTAYARKEFALRKDAGVLSRTANLLADLGRPVEAEELYRFCLAQTDVSRPEPALALATFLAGHNRLNEALDTFERAAAHCPAEKMAAIAVGALRLGEATASQRARVQSWLDGELRKKPDSPTLLVARADLLDASGDYAGSEQVYRDLLARNPDNGLALNNLAWLLAIHANQGEEALKLIDRAIELYGPGGDLLDTRASVCLVLGRPEEAVKALEDAVLQTPTGQRYFHLAQAFDKAGHRDAAKEKWIKATKELLLNEKTLHPLERADFQKFNLEFTTEKS
jgi:tetratricopeptide (TPR) repeat protein